MLRRILGLGLLTLVPSLLSAETRQAKWEELGPLVTGKTVSVVMAPGAVVTGKATVVEPDTLLVNVTKTTNRASYSKGSMRIPRATLRTVELHRKGAKFRVIGTLLGFFGGATAGGLAGLAIDGWECCDNGGAAAAAVLGLTAAGTVGGYALGNAADRHSVILEIVP